ADGIRISDDEALAVGQLLEADRASGGLRVAAAAVEDEDERRRLVPCQLRRHVQEESAFLATMHEVVGLVLGGACFQKEEDPEREGQRAGPLPSRTVHAEVSSQVGS